MMGTVETNQYSDKDVTENGGVTVIKGRQGSGKDVFFHTIVALAIWLGAMHFIFFLVLFSLFFLPFSKALLFVLPHPPFAD